MKRFLILLFFVLRFQEWTAQTRGAGFELGYIAPYFTNAGFSTSYLFGLKKQALSSHPADDKQRSIYFSLGMSYFAQQHVSRQVLVLPEMVFASIHPGRKWSVLPSLGVGYLLSFQKQEASLNLANGQMDYRYQTIHSVLPEIQVALLYQYKSCLGIFLRGFYGRKLSSTVPHTAFFGLSAGMRFTIQNNKAL
jgi:hypothetical protein